MQKTAQVISILFHPVFMPVYAFYLYIQIKHPAVLLFQTEVGQPAFNYVLLVLISLIVVIPMMSMMVMYRSGIISSFRIPERKERLPVLFLLFFYYGLTYFILKNANDVNYNFIGPFLSFMFSGVILSLIAFLITFKWKISLHSIAIGAMTGGFLSLATVFYPFFNARDFFYINSGLLILMGLVGTARLIERDHQLYEVIFGLTIGLIVSFFTIYFNLGI